MLLPPGLWWKRAVREAAAKRLRPFKAKTVADCPLSCGLIRANV